MTQRAVEDQVIKLSGANGDTLRAFAGKVLELVAREALVAGAKR